MEACLVVNPLSHPGQCGVTVLRCLSLLVFHCSQLTFIWPDLSCGSYPESSTISLLLVFTVSAVLTGASGQGICIAVQTPSLVLDLKIVVLQGLDPPGHLTLRLLEAEQPGQGSVVCPQKEPLAVEVGAKVFEYLNHCQELPELPPLVCETV